MIDDLGHLKYNEFQLYIENNFEFRRHPGMYDDTTPLTPEELRRVDEACRQRHIDFVPSLTSLANRATFDEFLAKDGLLAETEDAALKEIIADQIKVAMNAEGLTKTAMAARMRDL